MLAAFFLLATCTVSDCTWLVGVVLAGGDRVVGSAAGGDDDGDDRCDDDEVG